MHEQFKNIENLVQGGFNGELWTISDVSNMGASGYELIEGVIGNKPIAIKIKAAHGLYPYAD